MNYNSHPNHVQHSKHHADVHHPWHQWSEEETLHVATCYSNPYRWRTRRELFNDFRRHMERLPNVRLHVGELAYGDRPYEVTDPSTNPNDSQYRTHSALFHKENILNNVIHRFPHDWKYGAYVDGDFTFTRHDVALETIHQLQHHPWVQMFSQYADLGGGGYTQEHRQIGINNGFAYNYIQNGYSLPPGYENGGWKSALTDTDDAYYALGLIPGKLGVGATGGAWAFTRAGLDTVGTLLDVCILGHADWFMTFGLVGHNAPDMHSDGYSIAYQQAIKEWQNKAAGLHKNIGYVDCFATHHFHGSKRRRAYSSRDLILAQTKFDPVKDMRKNWCNVWELEPSRIMLRDSIRSYFVSRTEDDPNLYDGR